MNNLTRLISPVESIFSLSPFSVVAMIFRIKGHISKEQLNNAINSVEKKHPLLQVKISTDENNEKIYTSDNTELIELKTIQRKNENHWIDEYHNQCLIPFDFNNKPSIRFILLQSKDKCDLIIFSHHIICDGLSLAYLGRDILAFIGNSSKTTPETLDTIPITKDNIPVELQQNWLIKKVITKMNNKFNEERVYFSFDDYKELHKAYWENYIHKMITIELSEEQTASIIESCKSQKVSVNSAISTAIIGAQQLTLDYKLHKRNSIAVSIRDKIPHNPGEGMGFYAGSIDIPFVYNVKKDIWKNAIKFHKKVKSNFTIKNIFKNIFNWCYLEPGIMESIHFKILGTLFKNQDNDKLYSYSKREDVVASILQREKMNSLNNKIMGTAITNLGNLNFSEKFGELQLDSIIMNPGGAFPLTMVEIVASVVTTSKKMTILLEFEENRISQNRAQDIKNQFMKLLGL